MASEYIFVVTRDSGRDFTWCSGNPEPLSELEVLVDADLYDIPGQPGVWATALKAAGKPLRTFAPNRPQPAVSDRVRQIIIGRSGKWCEIMLPGCLGYGSDASHRKGTGSGGRHGNAKARHDVPSNVLWGCRLCHGHLHAEPAWAQHPDRGYALRQGQDPAATPVLYRRNRLVLLDNQGRITVYRGAAS